MASGERKTLTLDHGKMKMGFHEGMVAPECYEPLAQHLDKLKAMELRGDDVLLCSYPKSGTHWMYRVLDMLIRGQVGYDVRNADSTFLDVQDVDKMADLDSPRILITHLPFPYLPQQAQDKRTKIVHVYRNPKAVAVSLYFQMQSTALEKMEKQTLEQTAEGFLVNKSPYTGWFGYIDKVGEFQKANPDQPIFCVSYEEMTQNPVETVTKLASFLGVSAGDDFCKQVVEACSFNKQKAAEEKSASQAAMKFYRKGDMNDWKNHLTVALSERFDDVIKKRAESCTFSAKYAT